MKNRLRADKISRKVLSMTKPCDVIERCGLEPLASATGVKAETINRYRWHEKMPASWAPGVRAVAGSLSPPLFVPDECFSFKRRGGND